jgi:uncharacterized repeat protein (TIGR03943 family)
VSERRTQGTLLLAVGGMALFLGRGDLALSYVRAFVQPLLLASGAVLVVLGLAALVPPGARLAPATWFAPAARSGAPAGTGGPAGAADAEAHRGTSRVAWLLVVPLLVLILVGPPPLGSYAAGRRAPISADAAGGSMPPLEQPVNGAVPMELSEFYYRAVFDERHSLDGVRVRLLGFASPSHDGGYLLARFAMFCCAADAQVVEVAVKGDGVRRPADQWLSIEGYLRASLARGDGQDVDPSSAIPELIADSVTPVQPPRDRYEHTLFGY